MRVFSRLAERTRKQVNLLISRYRITSAEKAFISATSGSARSGSGDDPTVLVEAVEDHFYLALFADIVSGISADRPIRAQQLLSRSLRPGSSRSPIQAIKSLCFYNWLTDKKWSVLYGTFCSRVAYRSASAPLSRSSVAAFKRALQIWKNLQSNDMLLDMEISGIKVGDLIYDTYLRFKPAATLDLKSFYLLIVIWQTLRDLRAAREYMSGTKPRIFLASYSTYIQHGIAARVALALGVKVFTFGNYQEFFKQLTPTDWAHTRNPDNYRADFARLKNPVLKLAQAEKSIAARLAGRTDVATAYMQRSAYGSSSSLPEGIRGSLVLFLHDFFDSPHVYRWMIFADFLEWATFTLNLAREAGIKIFVKPHPNQMPGSKQIVRKLMTDYPEAIWLSTSTSNVQLAEAGVGCAVTVYGTVAHEMAYLGIPSISAGHNPHISFSICHTARNREEYSQLLMGYKNLADSPDELRRESLQFYCMHNLALSELETDLREVVIRFRVLVTRNMWLRDGGDFLSFVTELRAEPGFRAACKFLAAQLCAEPHHDVPQKITADAREPAAVP